MSWNTGKPKCSGLGVLRLSCGRCAGEKFIAADAVLEQTMAYCIRCHQEIMHAAEAHMPPSLEADHFIKDQNLNPRGNDRIWPPRPWEMAVS